MWFVLKYYCFNIMLKYNSLLVKAYYVSVYCVFKVELVISCTG